MVLKHALKDVDDEFGCFIEDDELDIPNFSLNNMEPKSAKKQRIGPRLISTLDHLNPSRSAVDFSIVSVDFSKVLLPTDTAMTKRTTYDPPKRSKLTKSPLYSSIQATRMYASSNLLGLSESVVEIPKTERDLEKEKTLIVIVALYSNWAKMLDY